MNTPTRTRLLLFALWSLAMAGGLLSACSDSTIFVAESSAISPDGRLEATATAVSQSSERGATYTRVTIRAKPDDPARGVPQVVLCTTGTTPPGIRWIDAGHVQLDYGADSRLDCPTAQPPGVVVLYRAEPAIAVRDAVPHDAR